MLAVSFCQRPALIGTLNRQSSLLQPAHEARRPDTLKIEKWISARRRRRALARNYLTRAYRFDRPRDWSRSRGAETEASGLRYADYHCPRSQPRLEVRRSTAF